MSARFPSFSLAFRNIHTRRWRTLLTLLGIVLGVAVVLAIQITNQSTLASLRQVFDRAAGQANLLVAPSNTRPENVLDEEAIFRVEHEPGVLQAAPSLNVYTLLASEAGSYDFNLTIDGVAAGTLLQLYGIDPGRDPEVRVYAMADGRLPEEDRYEAAVTEKYAGEKGLRMGSDLVIATQEGIARLRITGLLAEEGVGLINDGAVAFAPLSVVQDLFLRGGELDEIALVVEARISEDTRALSRLRDHLNERLGDEGQVIYPAARGQLVPQMLATYQQGLAFFSLIAIFVGAFLIYNTFSMTVVERTREIGMLRAIGMDRFQVIRMVMAEAALLSAAGSLIGLLAGYVLARGLMQLMGAVVSAEGDVFSVPWQGLAQSLLVGVGVTFGAALLPAIQAARISPLEALRARSSGGNKIGREVWMIGLALVIGGWLALYRVEWREEVLFPMGTTAVLGILLGATMTVPLVVVALEWFTRPLARLIYANEGALGSSNVRRSVGRTTLTVASLMVALTMVIGIGSLAYSFERDITGWIDTALGGDLYVRSPLTMRASLASQLAAVPGVEAVSPARYISVRVSTAHHPLDSNENDGLVFNAIDPDSYRQVGDMVFASGQGDPEANWARLSQGNALFISNVVADRYNVRQGDQLTLLTRRGEQAFTVAAEISDFTGEGFVVIGVYEDLHRWFSERGADRFTIKVAPGYSVEAVAEEIEARYNKQRNISTQTTQVFKANIRDLVSQSFRLFDVLNVIGVLIGALGVINTLTMNVIERRREIGGLRSLGMESVQVLRMVLAESLAMGLIGGVYGLTFGFIIAQILVLGMNLMSGYDLDYMFTAWPFILGILIALFVSQVAALYPARGAAAVNIVEAIKHE